MKEKNYLKNGESLKMLMVFCFLFAISMSMWGQLVTGEIKKVWVEYAAIENGEKGMKIHIDFSINNMLNKQGDCVVWFYKADGSKLKDTNGLNKTLDGQVSTSEVFKPGYENARYSDFKIFMPYKELHTSSGTNNLKFCIGIFDNNKKQIMTSEYKNFTFSTNIVNGYVSNSIITENVNGSKTMILMMDCTLCFGTGKTNCICCLGAGMQRHFNYYTVQSYYTTCTCCAGQGKTICNFCGGKGHIVKTSTFFPDSYTVPIIPPESGFSNGMENFGGSLGRSGSNRRQCPGCNGSGKGMDKKIYAPDYAGTGNNKYCSQCGSTGPSHSHHSPTCTVCNGKGYVE